MSHDPQTLCLACSASLPPARNHNALEVYTTPCCSQPICPSCISRNPRLARYNPCLACYAVGGGGGSSNSAPPSASSHSGVNLDGAVRDGDMFVLGDSDDDEEKEEKGAGRDTTQDKGQEEPELGSKETVDAVRGPPTKYYLTRTDTLQGLALKFGIPGRLLCRLNNLPPSTLTTTPHILHTRSFILLREDSTTTTTTAPQDIEITRAREKERAAKRLQLLTKETDWRIANAYVALATSPSSTDLASKEEVKGTGGGTMENQAVDQYLDDDAWEAAERREGRTSVGALGGFPYGRFRGEKGVK